MEIYGVEERPSCPGFRPIEGSAEALNKSMSCIDSIIKHTRQPPPAPQGCSGFSRVGSCGQLPGEIKGLVEAAEGPPCCCGSSEVGSSCLGERPLPILEREGGLGWTRFSIVGRPGCGLLFTFLLEAEGSLALPPHTLHPSLGSSPDPSPFHLQERPCHTCGTPGWCGGVESYAGPGYGVRGTQRGRQVQRPQGREELGVFRVWEGPEWSGILAAGQETGTETQRWRQRGRGTVTNHLLREGGGSGWGRWRCLGEAPHEPCSGQLMF